MTISIAMRVTTAEVVFGFGDCRAQDMLGLGLSPGKHFRGECTLSIFNFVGS
jgi:hypothetical protein